MAAVAAMEVTGLNELNSKFDALAAFAQKDAVVNALKTGAAILEEEEKQLVPEQSGALKRAIMVRLGRKSKTGFSVLLSASRRRFSGPTFYGGMVTFGFKTGKRGSENRKQIPGDNFVLHAFEEKGRAAGDAVVAELKAGIEREFTTAKNLANVK